MRPTVRPISSPRLSASPLRSHPFSWCAPLRRWSTEAMSSSPISSMKFWMPTATRCRKTALPFCGRPSARRPPRPCADFWNPWLPTARQATRRCPATASAARPARRKSWMCWMNTAGRWTTRSFPLWVWRPWTIPSTLCWWRWTRRDPAAAITSPAASWPRPRCATFLPTPCPIWACSRTTPTWT